MNLDAVTLQDIQAEWLLGKQVNLQVLRLDKIDPVVSGNKWFKLKYYLQEAKSLQKKTVATFGGAWSNHIVATAYACKQEGFRSIGVIRGEKPTAMSNTLAKAIEYGMELYFVSREQYRSKEQLKEQFLRDEMYWINEGGYGEMGAQGVSEILKLVDISKYTHIVAAVGTGTTVAGLLLSSFPHQKIVGISSMKGNSALKTEIEQLIGKELSEDRFAIMHNYHFGGYGKHPAEIIEFINDVFIKHDLPLDIVYTGKTFFALKDLVEKNYFTIGANILMIHTGGLQGNNSLPKKLLAF